MSDSLVVKNEALSIGEIADKHAAQHEFEDYQSRKADNTIRRQTADLARFADFLALVQIDAKDLQNNPQSWQGITYGLVTAFRNWMLQQGDSIGSINVRLSTVKTYAKLARKAGVISDSEYGLIRLVEGYSLKEAERVNEKREVTRRGDKKAQAIKISVEQAKQLKDQPDTPQGARDRVLMCLLLDHGLRCGEVALLKISNFDLQAGEMKFERPKVNKTQTHKLSHDTLLAVQNWINSGYAPSTGFLLSGSNKSGKLVESDNTEKGMSEQSITARVKTLGQAIGLGGLSAHDCRHFWATYWSTRVDIIRLQEAGGWNSLAMPRRYIEDSTIANEGMV